MNNQQKNTDQQRNDKGPSCTAKPQIGLYVFIALVVITAVAYYLIKK